MLVNRIALSILLAGSALPAASISATAQEKLRIGMISDFTGPFANVGIRLRYGIETFLAEKGNKVGGREVELIYRDVGNGSPAVAKQIAEELVVRDKVQMIGGFSVTPEVFAAAPVVTEGKIPSVIMVPSTPALMKMSPYFVRTSNNMISTVVPGADWAYKQGKRRAYIVVADFAPGHQVQETFKKKFTELGGTIVGEDRAPLSTVDYAPFAERIARANVDMVQMFVPTGTPSITFMRGLAAQGVFSKGLTVIGVGETDEADLPGFDDSVIGVYTSFYYASTLNNPENVAFKQKLAAKFKDAIPAPFAVAGYDSMNVLYKMAESQAGKTFDGDSAVKSVLGYKWNSPRGPVMIDPASRDIVENYYIRKVEKVDGRLQNVVVDTYTQQMPQF
ncbi:MAG TPA: ABC transporter substrate-binding protein [Xanthobacteraceae bacterium]|nr:ABC transporter substrate-binding protein [Xanthobacteraceae bacterium]